MIGQRVEVVFRVRIVDEPARHWWQEDKAHYEERPRLGTVMDRARDSAEYLVALDNGRLGWYWSNMLRMAPEEQP